MAGRLVPPRATGASRGGRGGRRRRGRAEEGGDEGVDGRALLGGEAPPAPAGRGARDDTGAARREED